jgi:hypothetical protein
LTSQWRQGWRIDKANINQMLNCFCACDSGILAYWKFWNYLVTWQWFRWQVCICVLCGIVWLDAADGDYFLETDKG